MNRTISRSAVVAATLAAAAASVAPAFAASPAAKPTSITLKPAHSATAPSQRDTLTATLKSGHTGLAGQTVLLEKRAAGSRTWTLVSTKTTDAKGQVVLNVTPGSRKGQKEQYEVVFKSTSSYKGSHSAVIILTVS